jgi:hypothetical protein
VPTAAIVAVARQLWEEARGGDLDPDQYNDLLQMVVASTDRRVWCSLVESLSKLQV